MGLRVVICDAGRATCLSKRVSLKRRQRGTARSRAAREDSRGRAHLWGTCGLPSMSGRKRLKLPKSSFIAQWLSFGSQSLNSPTSAIACAAAARHRQQHRQQLAEAQPGDPWR